MNKSRFDSIYRGLSSVAKKVYQAASETEYRSAVRIQSELFALGAKIESGVVLGCIASLVKSGILIETGDRGDRLFVRERIHEETVPKKPIKQKEKKAMPNIEPAEKPKSAVDQLLGVSLKLSDLATFIKTLAGEIDSVADAVEKTLAETDEEVQKLRQLKSLLKSFD